MSDEEQLLKKVEDLKKEAKRRKRSNWRRNRQRRNVTLGSKSGVFRSGAATIRYEVPNLVPRTPITD